MKKLAALVLTLSLILCVVAVCAENTPATVYVTISDGTLALAQKAVQVTDIDTDGALTVNDALYLAHEVAFEGGAQAGYASFRSDWGLSLGKLWGVENGGSYSYYINNAAVMDLTGTVADGDYINAYVFTDTAAYSDTYCWFDSEKLNAEAGTEITLTLTAAGFDANWNSITLPVAGAILTINGEKTEYITDEDGKAVLTVVTSAPMIVSAVSDTVLLVPPVCIINGAD